jgi:hypothetical protein
MRLRVNRLQGGNAMKEQDKTQNKTSVARRNFLRTLGAGAGVAATFAAPLASVAKADSENNDEKRKARYKETDHVKTFYRVNRYPG